MPGEQVHTLEWVLKATESYLAKCGVDSPRATAEFLAARLFRCRRSELAPRMQAPMAEAYLEAMRRGMKRLAAGEPLQYVLGEWDFHEVTLKTDRRALIPRPETETLVELALKFLRARPADAPAPFVLDYGTGSGCIAVAVAHALPTARVVALDVSEDALALARENAERNGVADRIAFLHVAPDADLLDSLDPDHPFDAIVSNPPYIPSRAVDALAPKVLAWEPRLALDGGADGMDVLRKISEEATMLLAPGGGIFLELDAESGEAAPVSQMLAESGFNTPSSVNDLNGATRFVTATLADIL